MAGIDVTFLTGQKSDGHHCFGKISKAGKVTKERHERLQTICPGVTNA
jgi:hypothetical protein